jgi:hypothetical protein
LLASREREYLGRCSKTTKKTGVVIKWVLTLLGHCDLLSLSVKPFITVGIIFSMY